ncbi:hypothetical protein FGIG_05277 [Fasciola gigantica]|uniref:DUF7041 domain-containing protein n=1 Tax=Fasciola gigantica TaxID=46835 RepID=A0A504Y5Q1_FASGI|nr:hypothetical protein FGIG_05277 [Fasciola gigantica]
MSDSPVLVESTGSRVPSGFTLPSFWRTDPPLWFASAEAQFLIHRVDVQEVRFAHVVAALQPDVARELRELILSPPMEKPYDAIKQQLCSMANSLRQEHVRKQAADEQLGADAPSKLLQRLREKLDPTCDEDQLKAVFIEKLPVSVQQILEPVSSELTAVKLAHLTDRISTQLACTTNREANHDSLIASQISHLRETLHDLKSVIKQLSEYIETANKPCDLDGGNIKICWYHRRYGGKAFKCARSCVLSQALAPPTQFQSANTNGNT